MSVTPYYIFQYWVSIREYCPPWGRLSTWSPDTKPSHAGRYCVLSPGSQEISWGHPVWDQRSVHHECRDIWRGNRHEGNFFYSFCLCKEYSVLHEIGLLQIWSVKNLLTASGIRQESWYTNLFVIFYVDQGICFLPFVHQARRQALTTC